MAHVGLKNPKTGKRTRVDELDRKVWEKNGYTEEVPLVDDKLPPVEPAKPIEPAKPDKPAKAK